MGADFIFWGVPLPKNQKPNWKAGEKFIESLDLDDPALEFGTKEGLLTKLKTVRQAWEGKDRDAGFMRKIKKGTTYTGRSTGMGWTSCRMDKPLKEFITSLYQFEFGGTKNEVLECRIKNLKVAYLAVKTTYKEVLQVNQTDSKDLPLLMGSLTSNEGQKALAARLAGLPSLDCSEVWAGVCLIHFTPRSDFNISYKEMTEDSGPCEVDCPESILKRLTLMRDRGYAADWRKKCWDRIESLKSKPRLVTGCLVKFAKPVEFVGGWSADTVLVEDAFRQRYREPKRDMLLRIPRRYFQNHDYTILPKEIAEQTHASNSIIA